MPSCHPLNLSMVSYLSPKSEKMILKLSIFTFVISTGYEIEIHSVREYISRIQVVTSNCKGINCFKLIIRESGFVLQLPCSHICRRFQKSHIVRLCLQYIGIG